ncbi:hypothetical protein H0H87_005486 [Tephrocybe sp. NHM501043]|nr:hypothetical protein H0H87_005486 [Tephrocybe sp. NHM501043]
MEESHQGFDGPTPQYTLPSTFKIGKKCTEAPLVTGAHLKGHLALLGAFAGLRVMVEGLKAEEWKPDRYIPENKHKRWVWFVGLAVERFEMWATSLVQEDANRPSLEFLPPLDILMLSSLVFSLISNALGPIQKQDPGFTTFLSSNASTARIKFWNSRVKGRCFDALEDADKHRTKAVLCPFCQKPHETPFINVDGTGYLQSNFRFFCSNKDCATHEVNTNRLAIRKFANDLIREDNTLQSYFAYVHPALFLLLCVATHSGGNVVVPSVLCRPPLILDVRDALKRNFYLRAVFYTLRDQW